MKLNRFFLSIISLLFSLPVMALDASETSSVGGFNLVVVPVKLSYATLDLVALPNKVIKLDKIIFESNIAHIYGHVGETTVEFIINPKVARSASLNDGTIVDVTKNKMGYTLTAAGKAIGVVPNEKFKPNFERKKLENTQ